MSGALGLALNLIALLLVVGLSWAALMWMGRRSSHGAHSTAARSTTEPDVVERDLVTGRAKQPFAPSMGGQAPPCTTCEGVGASSTKGRVVPCKACHGTGVRR